MTNRLELFRCKVCGNIAEILVAGDGELVCCKELMERLTLKTEDMGQEKHVPVIEKQGDEVTIKIGSEPHPMENDHYIQFVEAISNDNKYLKRKYFKPGDEPVLRFKCECKEGVSAREYCNIHGLWGTNKK